MPINMVIKLMKDKLDAHMEIKVKSPNMVIHILTFNKKKNAYVTSNYSKPSLEPKRPQSYDVQQVRGSGQKRNRLPKTRPQLC